MVRLTRRQALKVLGGATVAAAAGGLPRQLVGWATAQEPARPLLPRPGRRVVIVGCGISGAMCARTLRKLAPDVEVVVLERNPSYVSGPSHVDYLVGLEDARKVTVGFDGLVREGVKVIRAGVTGVRPGEGRVLTAQGFVEYSVLVLATGLVPAEHEVRNLLENRRLSPHAWTWAGTVELRRAVEAFGGGTFVISVPPPPYKCPPGPYEVACLVQEYWQKKGVRAEVVVLDASDRPQPPLLADLWRRVLQEKGIVYRPSFKVVELDPTTRTLISDRGERQRFDLASVIPPQRAPLFVEEAGLGTPFVPIDPATFRSRAQENVYATGDVAASPYTKSAFTAFLQGRNAAYHIARALGRDRGEPDPVFNQCWPFVSSKEALLVEVAWDKEGRAIPGRNRTGPPAAAHVQARKSWEYGILRAAYG
ncbi:MAG: FAD/NAD(P)-binding oxidoreductase [Armatimonadota bacterium]|nr:FAD/NAD(P)-binding oxidoreductase [Armatimonadota bacterium]MDR7400157.1 FAD/NAD(P)-binding oxidoreductase [Armatimonadota bacterium]MDR7414384.1 FAD/NAD(P)-binding oxidoreductase [Armatimonadota bacterium]MDR7441986.1 FAD/NAD(P)-binding oxidoreductase [Armatimonadota bacterium]MDR7594141.1 FAD/NAD(P)-binding oxidoreductase [Armatimonadota bacterium]